MTVAISVTPNFKHKTFKKGDGISIYTNELIKTLKVKNIDFVKYVFKSHDIKKEEINNEILLQNFLLYTFIGFFKKDNFYSSFIKKKNISLIHCTDHRIIKNKKIPTISTIHDLIPILNKENERGFIRREVVKFILKNNFLKSDRVITPSNYSADIIKKYLNIKNHEIFVIPHGVNKTYFEKQSDKKKKLLLSKLKISENFFLFISTISPRKNLSRVVSAFEKILEIYPNFNLVISGRINWINDKKLFKKIFIHSKINYFDYLSHDEIRLLYQSAKAYVFPSLYEGFGLTVLEAFASNCPVITSSTTSLNELGKDCSLQVNPQSTDEIYNAMKNIITNKHMIVDMTQSAYEKAKKFTWEKSCNMHLEAYKNTIDNFNKA